MASTQPIDNHAGSYVSAAFHPENVALHGDEDDLKRIVATLEVTLRNVNALVQRVDREIAPELRQTLESARAALGQAQGALSDEAPLQGDLRGTLRDVTRAAEAIRNLADYLERHPESLLRGRRDEEPTR